MSTIFSTPMSPVTVLVTSLAVFVTCWLLAKFNSKQARALRKFPRPQSTLFLIGNTLDMMQKQRHRIHDWLLEECVKTHGEPWLLTGIDRPPSLVLSKEEHFEDVLQHQFKIFEKGATGALLANEFFGEGIFIVDGEKWSKLRKIASAVFANRSMRDIMEKTISDCTSELLPILRDASVNHKPLEFNHLMLALMMDVFTKIGFGVHPHCLQGGGGFDKGFLDAFSRCGKVIQYRLNQPMWLWQLKKKLNIGMEKQLAKDMAFVNTKIYEIISASMAKRASENHTHPSDLVLSMLDRYFEDDCEPNPQIIRDMSMGLIGAGRGPTSQSLLWFFVSLNQNPEALAKIQQELAEKIPDLISNKKAIPDKSDVQRLVYLEAALRESMRLHPTSPFSARTSNEDTTLRDGTFIPKGTRVIIPSYTAGRSPWTWGDDAMEYKPERWIDDDNKIKPISPFKFLVFHAGPRLCLGVNLVMLELKIIAAAILSKYNIQIIKNPHEVEYDLSLSLPIKGELYVNVQPLDWTQKNAQMVAMARSS